MLVNRYSVMFFFFFNYTVNSVYVCQFTAIVFNGHINVSAVIYKIQRLTRLKYKGSQYRMTSHLVDTIQHINIVLNLHYYENIIFPDFIIGMNYESNKLIAFEFIIY